MFSAVLKHGLAGSNSSSNSGGAGNNFKKTSSSSSSSSSAQQQPAQPVEHRVSAVEGSKAGGGKRIVSNSSPSSLHSSSSDANLSNSIVLPKASALAQSSENIHHLNNPHAIHRGAGNAASNPNSNASSLPQRPSSSSSGSSSAEQQQQQQFQPQQQQPLFNRRVATSTGAPPSWANSTGNNAWNLVFDQQQQIQQSHHHHSGMPPSAPVPAHAHSSAHASFSSSGSASAGGTSNIHHQNPQQHHHLFQGTGMAQHQQQHAPQQQQQNSFSSYYSTLPVPRQHSSFSSSSINNNSSNGLTHSSSNNSSLAPLLSRRSSFSNLVYPNNQHSNHTTAINNNHLINGDGTSSSSSSIGDHQHQNHYPFQSSGQGSQNIFSNSTINSLPLPLPLQMRGAGGNNGGLKRATSFDGVSGSVGMDLNEGYLQYPQPSHQQHTFQQYPTPSSTNQGGYFQQSNQYTNPPASQHPTQKFQRPQTPPESSISFETSLVILRDEDERDDRERMEIEQQQQQELLIQEEEFSRLRIEKEDQLQSKKVPSLPMLMSSVISMPPPPPVVHLTTAQQLQLQTQLQLPPQQEQTMRTLYFGNLPPSLPLSTFLNYIHVPPTSGGIEEVKYITQKNCVFITFLEAGTASAVYTTYEGRLGGFRVEGYEVRVGWGKSSNMYAGTRHQVYSKGASRSVFIGELSDEQMNGETYLRGLFEQFGVIECIQIQRSKKGAFVHMCSVAGGIRAVLVLGEQGERVFYAKDRLCADLVESSSISDLEAMAMMGEDLIMETPSLEENRTVYIGGIHPDITCKDLCDIIRGGVLQQIKYFPEKNICFVTFIEAASAEAFYRRYTTTPVEGGGSGGLVLKTKRAKLGWGKATPLPSVIRDAVREKGASRNIYIGLPINSSPPNDTDFELTKEELIEEYGIFGDIETINLLPEKRIAFVCFTDITAAMRVIEVNRSGGGGGRGGRKINFGKDRCSGPIRAARAPFEGGMGPVGSVVGGSSSPPPLVGLVQGGGGVPYSLPSLASTNGGEKGSSTGGVGVGGERIVNSPPTSPLK